MVVMEVNQLTGYSAVDLNDVRSQVGTALKRVEDSDDKMVLYFDEVNSFAYVYFESRMHFSTLIYSEWIALLSRPLYVHVFIAL